MKEMIPSEETEVSVIPEDVATPEPTTSVEEENVNQSEEVAPVNEITPESSVEEIREPEPSKQGE